jgi:hypothetical protein
MAACARVATIARCWPLLIIEASSSILKWIRTMRNTIIRSQTFAFVIGFISRSLVEPIFGVAFKVIRYPGISYSPIVKFFGNKISTELSPTLIDADGVAYSFYRTFSGKLVHCQFIDPCHNVYES